MIDMFDSAQSTLDNYIDTTNVHRFTFYSVEMERGENAEDLYYLCSTRDGRYVVFETDYILGTLADIALEATEIFKGYNLAPLHWIVRKDAQASVGASTVPIDASNLEELRTSLLSDRAGSPFSYALRYAVIEFADTRRSKQSRFSPTAYGSTISQ
jgi:hypothetical protein